MDQENWVLITGGSRGIGRGVVECLAEAGYKAIFTYSRSSDEAATIEEAAAAQGHYAKGHQCDGTDADSIEKLVKSLVSQHGAPLALINNAGITDDSLLFSMPIESWDKVIATNLKPVFLFSRLVLPSMMEERNGVILNMSSVTAIKGNVGQTNYAATKAAMLGLTKSLALEVGRFNIRVNSILPGLVETEMVKKIPEQERKAIQKNIPLKRLCSVAEIGKLVKYLISDDASYITAQSLSIDGGLSA